MEKRDGASLFIFVNREEGRLRAGWRILLQAGIMAVVVSLPIVGVTETATRLFKSGRIGLPPELFDKMMDIAVGFLLTGLVLFSLFLAGRKLDRRSFADFGFQLNARWVKEWFYGIFFGFCLIATAFFFEYLAGWVKVTGYFHVSIPVLPIGVSFIYPFAKAVCVGTYEEALSRGYHQTNLKEGFLGVRGLKERGAAVAAICFSSAFFALLHLRNPNANVISTLALFANGALFGRPFGRPDNWVCPSDFIWPGTFHRAGFSDFP